MKFKLTESLTNNVKIYEVEKDGLPEIGRRFIAYRIEAKEFGIFTRENKSKWDSKSDASYHRSPDGEFYAGDNDWIYSVGYDRYCYVDELNLISNETKSKHQNDSDNFIKEATQAFINAFGNEIGKKLAKAFIVEKKHGDGTSFKVDYPFDVYQGKLKLNSLSIKDDSVFKKNGLKSFISICTSHGMSKSDAVQVLKALPSVEFDSSFTRNNIADEKDKIDAFDINSITEAIEKQPDVKYKGFTIEHFPYTMSYKDEENDINGWIIHSPYYLQSDAKGERQYMPLYCEDENGEEINFPTADAAKEYVDKYMVTKKGKVKIKYGDEVHFELLSTDESLVSEDTIKLKDHKWTNKGKEGTHGNFTTKKEADAQRKAMFAGGYKG